MSFHLGKPILVMMIVSLISGVFILRRPTPPKADLNLWVFADAHYRTVGEIIPEFERRHGLDVHPVLRYLRPMTARLVPAYVSRAKAEDNQALVDLDIGDVGRFLRPAPDDIGLLPLEEPLKESRYCDQLVRL